MYQLITEPRFFYSGNTRRFWAICIVSKQDSSPDLLVYTLFGAVPVQWPRKNLVRFTNPDDARLNYYQKIVNTGRRFYKEFAWPSTQALKLPDPLIYLNENRKIAYSGCLLEHLEGEKNSDSGDVMLDRMKDLEL